MKKILFAILVIVSLSGCVNTSMLSETQRIEAVKRYPFSESLNITPENGVAMTSLKIFGRVFVDILTFGAYEIELYNDRENTYNTYLEHDLRYNPLIGKTKSALIDLLGAPARRFPDGLNGEIYIYEHNKVYGGGNQYGSWINSYKEIIEFYYNPEGICYKWRRQIK